MADNSKDNWIITPSGNIPGRRIIKAQVVLNAWHNYCMQSRIFRLFVKLGLRQSYDDKYR